MKLRLLTLLVVIVAGSGIAVAARGGGSSRTLDLTATVTTQGVSVDVEPVGQSAGDIGYLAGPVFAHGKRAGRFQGYCVTISKASSECSFTLGLAGGQIAIRAGYGPGLNTGRVALESVVGGTGAYEGARGEGRDREVGNNKLEFHLHLM